MAQQAETPSEDNAAMARKNDLASALIAEADEVRRLTPAQLQAIPGLLGRVARVKVAHDGAYGYTDSGTGRFICILPAECDHARTLTYGNTQCLDCGAIAPDEF